MKPTPVFDHALNYLANEWRPIAKSLDGVLHAGVAFVRSTPSNGWAMCAFVAAASIMVTLVTAYLWPRETTEAPVRETMDAAGVRRLARRGFGTSEIARRTGLSHDAVATIVRASTLARGERTAPTRKTRPTAA